MHRSIYGWILCAVSLLIIGIPACNEFSQVAEKTREAANDLVEKGRESGILGPAPGTTTQTSQRILDRNPGEVVIGTMNIEKFGVKKIADKEVMPVLVKIARQFDCLAIQEIQSRHDQTILEQFVNMINADGSQYSYVISALLGTERYTEQYAYVFDTSRIELMDQGFVVPDPYNLLQREPMVCRFRTRTADPSQAFTFALANVHTVPSQSRSELTTLYEVYVWLKSYMNDEDDIIMLGDFNEPPRKYGQLWQIQTLAAALPDGVFTNTAQNASYDNVLFDRQFTHEFTGKAGVMDIERTFGLTRDQAQRVSDHLPVWAVFTAGERRSSQYAVQPAWQGR
ncbi:MAG: exonuclease/endonuclease/phosphatase family protein [Pirellulaceae bacterium]